MAKSAQRHKHQAHQHHGAVKPKPKRNAALLMAIFIGLVGLVLAAFASGLNVVWMTGSAAIGAIAGALIGHGIDKSIEKK